MMILWSQNGTYCCSGTWVLRTQLNLWVELQRLGSQFVCASVFLSSRGGLCAPRIHGHRESCGRKANTPTGFPTEGSGFVTLRSSRKHHGGNKKDGTNKANKRLASVWRRKKRAQQSSNLRALEAWFRNRRSWERKPENHILRKSCFYIFFWTYPLKWRTGLELRAGFNRFVDHKNLAPLEMGDF